MNIKGWILGLIITILQSSITAFNILGQFPTATVNQLVIILYPVVVGMIVTFLIRSPFPGATLPPGLINGSITMSGSPLIASISAEKKP